MSPQTGCARVGPSAELLSQSDDEVRESRKARPASPRPQDIAGQRCRPRCGAAAQLSDASGGGATAAGDCAGLFRHTAGVVKGSAEHDLDLGVEAAELVSGPAGEGVMDGGVEAQRDLLALAAHV
jgi:hypothetical protein